MHIYRRHGKRERSQAREERQKMQRSCRNHSPSIEPPDGALSNHVGLSHTCLHSRQGVRLSDRCTSTQTEFSTEPPGGAYFAYLRHIRYLICYREAKMMPNSDRNFFLPSNLVPRCPAFAELLLKDAAVGLLDKAHMHHHRQWNPSVSKCRVTIKTKISFPLSCLLFI